MAIINKLENAASVAYGGSTINSNIVETVLLLPPTLLKTVDKVTASIGETLTYTVTVANAGLNRLESIPFTDVLPTGSQYVAGSFTVGGTGATPTINGNTLTYTIAEIAALGSVVIQFQAEVIGGNI